jgi:phosphomannomutase
MAAYTFDPSILREYDIRGTVGKTLFTEDGVALGKKFGLILRQSGKKRICIGRDGRLTSPLLVNSLIDGLLWAGMSITDLGIGPTPLIYYGLKTLPVDAAIMVTGSHNPASDNGFKIALKDRPFFGADIQDLAGVDETIFSAVPGHIHEQDIKQSYINRLLEDYTPPPNTRSLKIVWDAGNGATGDILKSMVKGIQGEHILLNETIDGTFPAHHPDPTVAENLEQLINAVKHHRADAGIAFDGDGDRIGVVDSQGRIIWGDQLLLLLAKDVVLNNPGAKIIADVKSSQGLFDEIGKIGGDILMARTGHSLIKTKMAETGALLAGEMSGHIFFADKYYGYDDALYAAIRFVNILYKSDISLNETMDRLPHFYNTPEMRIDCDDKKKFQIVKAIHNRLVNEQATFSDIDGVRVSRTHGWWLLRASNTQPALVARCESTTPEGLEILKKEVAEYLTPWNCNF